MSVVKSKLPKVNTRKEFMDYLENIIYPPKNDDDYENQKKITDNF